MRFVSKLFRKRRCQVIGAGDFIAFVAALPARTRVRLEDDIYSELASARLRMIIPARQLVRHIPVWLVPLAEFIERPRLEHLGRAHATIVGKLSSAEVLANHHQLRALVRVLRNKEWPGRLFADLSDHYAGLGTAAGAPFLAEYQHGLGRACELVVPTAALAAVVRSDARRGLHVVEDPFETAEAPVRVWSGGPVHLAWFGSIGVLNLPLIEDGLEDLAAAFPDREIRVEVVAQAAARASVLALGKRLASAYPRFSIAFTAWSLAGTDAAIERCDFVWLPQEVRQSWGQVKSHNRLVSAIRGGRLAIAAPIPSYQELGAYSWVGEPLSEGLAWALANSEQAANRVRAGQAYVEQRFSPEAIGRRWAEVLGLSHRSETERAG